MTESKARARAIEKINWAKNNKLGLREFSKTKNSQQVKNTGLSLKDIQSIRNINTKVSSFSSPHDDIFKRISNCIELLCRTDRILDCKK